MHCGPGEGGGTSLQTLRKPHERVRRAPSATYPLPLVTYEQAFCSTIARAEAEIRADWYISTASANESFYTSMPLLDMRLVLLHFTLLTAQR